MQEICEQRSAQTFNADIMRVCIGGNVNGTKPKALLLEEFDGATTECITVLVDFLKKYPIHAPIIATANNIHDTDIVKKLGPYLIKCKFNRLKEHDLIKIGQRVAAREHNPVTQSQLREFASKAQGDARNMIRSTPVCCFRQRP